MVGDKMDSGGVENLLNEQGSARILGVSGVTYPSMLDLWGFSVPTSVQVLEIVAFVGLFVWLMRAGNQSGRAEELLKQAKRERVAGQLSFDLD